MELDLVELLDFIEESNIKQEEAIDSVRDKQKKMAQLVAELINHST